MSVAHQVKGEQGRWLPGSQKHWQAQLHPGLDQLAAGQDLPGFCPWERE